MKQDLEQIKLLSIFHLILGIMTSIVSLFPLIYVGMGIAALHGQLDEKGSPAPPFIGWMLIAIGLAGFTILVAISIVMIIASRRLKLHKSRMFCLVVAGIECIMTPLGTVLGVFTIITLIKDSVIKLFEGDTSPDSQLKPEQPGPCITS